MIWNSGSEVKKESSFTILARLEQKEGSQQMTVVSRIFS
jgi:hypothetical protein